MYNEKIEALIKAALADGVLTEKEKQVLFKKAYEQGIDLDEFEIIMDAKLLEAQIAEKERRAKAAPKSDKYADVKKCPACGTIIPPNIKVCPGCGLVFSNEQDDIKEIAQLQDNFVKICKENAKFPLGYIYISILILVTLFNVFAWVYAITTGWLAGLVVLSMIIWIGTLIWFSARDKIFSSFSENYNAYVAEHTRLYSTAKAFYSQDKNTLERINNVAERVGQTIAKNNKVKKFHNLVSYGTLAATIILSLILSFGWFRNVLIHNSAHKTAAVIEKALAAGNLTKAQHYQDNYNRRSLPSEIIEKFVDYYISKGQYQDAINYASSKLGDSWGHSEDYFKVLEKCVVDLRRKNKNIEAQKLIKDNLYLFEDEDYFGYDKSTVNKKLSIIIE